MELEQGHPLPTSKLERSTDISGANFIIFVFEISKNFVVAFKILSGVLKMDSSKFYGIAFSRIRGSSVILSDH